MQPLALSHYSLVSAVGTGRPATFAALKQGRSALAPCRFETVEIPTYAGQVEGLDDIALPPALAAFDCRNNRLAEMALVSDGFAEAVAAARARYGARRIGLFLGTSTSGIFETEQAYRMREGGPLARDFRYAEAHNTFSLAAYVGRRLGLEGPAMVVSAACASTAKVFATAARMIEAGLCDAAVVGGADSLCLTTLYGFQSLQLTSAAPCRPFDIARDGISVGEGAGFALLERAAAGGAALQVLGVGESSDAYHMSSPHPEGLGARTAMDNALDAAGLSADRIGFIKMHGTATPVGDAAEDKAVVALFGCATPCASLKGYIGHTLGGSGIVEIGMAALCLEHGFLPATIGTEIPDPGCHAGHLWHARDEPVSAIMCNSFGFGGSNCSVVLGRP